MAVSKVVYGTTVLVDLTNDTVTTDCLLKNYTAHDKSGKQVVGALNTISTYTGTSAPSDNFGKDGDLFFVISDAASDVNDSKLEEI